MADEKEETGSFEIYVVGDNSNGPLGPETSSTTLTKWTGHSNIKSQIIHMGQLHSIIRNGDEQMSFGNNSLGQCGVGSKDGLIRGRAIKYFSRKHIQVRKICCASTSSCTFWLSSDGKAADQSRIF